ncbi:MAG: DUF3800 domain-containing protein [Chloroflexota bacterium]
MYLLYLDDSGSPNNPHEDYFVLGGICVPESSVRWLSHQLDQIACKYGTSQSVELHAAEIFRGKAYPWNNINDKKQRVKIIQEVLNVLNDAYQNTVLFAYAIHKKSFPQEDPVLKAYEDLAARFNNHLEQNISTENRQEKGLIILDKSSYETGLQSLTNNIRISGNRWGQQMRSIVEVPLFVDSSASRITQLADHVAYAVFRMYQANDLTYFNCIQNKFYEKDGILHGLVHRQTINYNCTCPACMSRRIQARS